MGNVPFYTFIFDYRNCREYYLKNEVTQENAREILSIHGYLNHPDDHYLFGCLWPAGCFRIPRALGENIPTDRAVKIVNRRRGKKGINHSVPAGKDWI